MLDGLLGRGAFYSKCKSLLKLTRTRIDVIRRKRSATQNFLKNDVAQLLAHGREIKAYERAEGVMTELIISSCYDFIDHACEIILKHLSVMQKLRECPEDCREAVASLMFAAARFSDLPELRELRDIFQERYGNLLDFAVNPKFAQNIAPKSLTMDKKVQLMQDIASEFSLKWDPNGFEHRMLDASAVREDQAKSNVPPFADQNHAAPTLKEASQKSAQEAVNCTKRNDATYHNKGREVPFDRHQVHVHARAEETVHIRDEVNVKIANGRTHISLTGKPPISPAGNSWKVEDDHSSNPRRKDNLVNGHGSAKQDVVAREAPNNRTAGLKRPERTKSPQVVPERHLESQLSKGKPQDSPIRTEINGHSADIQDMENVAIVLGKEPDSVQPRVRSAMPPPYVKPVRSKHKESSNSKNSEHDALSRNAPSDGDRTEKPQVKQSGSENEDGPGRFTEVYYKDTEPTLRKRSNRKKHSKSSSIDDVSGDLKEGRVVRRISSSRRRGESKKGLQILFDEDHYRRKDEEEKMMDKLLMRYCQKSPQSDHNKLRRKPHAESPDQSTRNKGRDGSEAKFNKAPPPSRSISMPRESSSSEHTKVFTRAASFQQEPVKHVHPKLPDYDDLAARFAALRNNMK